MKVPKLLKVISCCNKNPQTVAMQGHYLLQWKSPNCCNARSSAVVMKIPKLLQCNQLLRWKSPNCCNARSLSVAMEIPKLLQCKVISCCDENPQTVAMQGHQLLWWKSPSYCNARYSAVVMKIPNLLQCKVISCCSENAQAIAMQGHQLLWWKSPNCCNARYSAVVTKIPKLLQCKVISCLKEKTQAVAMKIPNWLNASSSVVAIKNKQAVAMKIYTIMWWMIKNMVTHEVLSPYGMHLSMCNCIHQTPLLSIQRGNECYNNKYYEGRVEMGWLLQAVKTSAYI